MFQALASCIAVGFAYNAATRGISVDALELSLEGDHDLRAFLGLSEEVNPGYEGIRMSYRVKSDAPHEEIVAL